MEQQTLILSPPPPPLKIKDEAAQKTKRAMLPSLLGGAGKGGTNFLSILPKIVARHTNTQIIQQKETR